MHTLVIVLASIALSSEATGTESPADTSADEAGAVTSGGDDTEAQELDPNRLEIGAMPALGYDSNTGFGFGAIATFAKFAPGKHPYDWRIEALVFMTIMGTNDGGVELPFHDYYLLLDLPGLLDNTMRITAKAAFGRRTTTGYYGFGNASQLEPARTQQNDRFNQYDRISPHLDITTRTKMLELEGGRLELTVGAGYTHNWINTYPGSKLEEDLAGAGDAVTSRLLIGDGQNGVLTGMVGIAWDSRDHESAPTSGMFHELSLRGGTGSGGRYDHGGINVTGRFFLPVWREYLVVAARIMGDFLFGHPPFYELALHGGLHPSGATGGATSVRGIVDQRFHGKAKVLGNLEVRSKFLPFEAFDQRFNVGLLVFADAGRVWTDYSDVTNLDGSGIGIKVGTGGGLRLQWGETFILRGDFAYSPTEDTIGYYIDINHIF